MELTVIQLMLIAVLGFVAIVDGVGPKVFMAALALIASAMVGLIFGNLPVAIITGAAIQITLIAAIPIGGASPPDQTSAAIVGASLAEILYPGGDLATFYGSTVLGLVIPFAIIVAVLGVQLEILARTANIFWVRRAERMVARGEAKGIQTSHLLGFIPWGLSRAILCPIAVVLGVPALGLLQNLTSDWFLKGLTVAGSVLPAAGLAMILSILPLGRMRRFFLAGFVICWLMIVMSPFLGIIGAALNPVLVATLIGLVAAWIMTKRRYPGKDKKEKSEQQKAPIEFKTIAQKDLSSTFLRYFLSYEASWNYERMQGLGYLYCMLPILKKTHTKKDDLKNAMKMHMEFFNTNPFIASWILGMSAKMEDEGAPAETIRSVKVGYMGPLAGIGDSIIYFVVGGMAMIIGSSMAFYGRGDVTGVLVLWGIMAPVGIILRIWFWRIGLRRGTNAAKQIRESTGLKRVMELTGATGLTTIGAFIPIAVQVGLPVQAFGLAETDPMLQILNGISLFVIPLLWTLVAYFLAKRGYSIVKIILILFVIGLVSGSFGLLVRPIYSALPIPTLGP
jgi:mannose/fructose/N-acetylgalactosamine-specific phosphotransferase system component IID